MKVIVGLGNPGDKYAGTRHNVGFDVLDELARQWGAAKPKLRFEAQLTEILCDKEKLLLCAPQTFMNLSGRSVQQVCRFFQIENSDVLVVCDDLNLDPGQIRLRPSGSAGGQKGLQSILTCMGSQEIPRLRLGIGRPQPPMDAVNYVLAKFRKEELQTIDAAVIRAARAVQTWASEGMAAAMNRFNGPADSVSNES
jgi:peptidyl-tRNA hydrolase, PTH1 family